MTRVKHSALFLRRGSILMGNDGFGPAVREDLKTGLLSDKVAAGAGWGRVFDCLPAPETRPEGYVFRGAIASPGRRSGDVLSVDVSLLPAKKIHDSSLHRSSPINLPPELQRYTGICIDILAAQVALISDETPFRSSLSGVASRAGEKILQPLFASERIPG